MSYRSDQFITMTAEFLSRGGSELALSLSKNPTFSSFLKMYYDDDGYTYNI